MRPLSLLAPLLFALAGCATSGGALGGAPTADAEARDLVVLIHGMGRSPFSMVPLDLALRRDGHRTLNVGYDSFGPSIEEIAAGVAAEIDRAVESEAPRRIHFVGHSLGNIIARQLIATDRPERLGRVVMLAPPNQGSATADRLTRWVGWMLRPIGELRTAESTVAAMPPPRDVEVAIIAGDRDTKVSVDESRLAGAAEHVVVASGHTWIMTKPSVMRRVRCFVETGATECGG